MKKSPIRSREELNEALNLILGFLCDYLPEGWSIQIEASKFDCSVKLFDEVDEVSKDFGTEQTQLRSMVDYARESAELPPLGD